MKVCKKVTSVFALVLILSLLTGVTGASAATSSDGNHYTYIYDCWGYDRESPDAYSVTRIITGSDYEVRWLQRASGNVCKWYGSLHSRYRKQSYRKNVLS